MLRRTVIALAVLALAAPLDAYTIYLKDGARLIAKEKYRIEGDRAIITLQNGTQTFLEATEIDVERTERANRNNYGTAVVLEDGQFTDTPTAPPPRREERLGDVARDPALPNRPTARRPELDASRGAPAAAGGAAYPDLFSARRAAYRDLELAGEIQRVFLAQGVEGVQLLQGTAADRLLVEVVTNSEASVFRALKVAADALVHVRTRTAAPISAFELVLITSSRERAGQFLLDPASAGELSSGAVDVASFFVDQVQF